MPDRLWHPALDQDGSLRAGAEVAELTGMVELIGYPDGTRIKAPDHPRPEECRPLGAYEAIADTTCSATTIRSRRDE